MLYQCDGSVEVAIGGNYDGTPIVEIEDLPFLSSYTKSFGAEPYDDAHVVACCESEYEDGCEASGQAAPHLYYCISDCAEQACLRIHKELETVVDQLVFGVLFANLLNLQNYMANNLGACTDAIRMGSKCLEAAANLGLNTTLCDSSTFRIGRWEIEDDPIRFLLDGLYIDAACEVYDWQTDPAGPISCFNNQGNNGDPFGLFGDPVPLSMQANIPTGKASVFTLQNGWVNSELSGNRILFRDFQCQDDGCLFKVDEFQIVAETVELGQFSIGGVSTDLERVATGIREADTVTFAHGEIELRVTGTLGGVPMDYKVENFGPAKFKVSDDMLTIDWLLLRGGPFLIRIITPELECILAE